MDHTEMLGAVRGATSLTDLKRLLGQCATTGDVEWFARVAGAHARYLDTDLALAIAAIEEGAQALVANPYIADDVREHAFLGIAERFIQGHVGGNSAAPRTNTGTWQRPYLALSNAASIGLITPEGAIASRLWRSAEEDAAHLYRFRLLPTMHVKILLEMPALPAERLHDLCDRLEVSEGCAIPVAQNNVSELVAHPNSDERVWLAILSMRPPRIENVLASRRALESPAVRTRIFELASANRMGRPLDALVKVCAKAESGEFLEVWKTVAARDPKSALQVLERAGKARLTAFPPDALTSFLASDDRAVRERTIAVLSKLRQRSRSRR